MATVDGALLARIVRELWGLTGPEADLANQRTRLMLGKARAHGWDLHIVDGPRNWYEMPLRRISSVDPPGPEEDVFDPDLEPDPAPEPPVPPSFPAAPPPPVKKPPARAYKKPFPPKPIYGRHPHKPRPTNQFPRPILGCNCSLAGCDSPTGHWPETPFWLMETIPCGLGPTGRWMKD